MQRMLLLPLALVLAAGAAQAQAQDKFQRKSGLWEIKRTSTATGGQEYRYELCVDQASDNALGQLIGSLRSERCETSKVARDGNTVTVDAVCTIEKGRRKATTHAVVTGKFDSAYKVESKSTFDPPRPGGAEGTALLDAKWTGECKPGQRPGDLLLPTGVKVNINDEIRASRGSRMMQPRREKGGYTPAPSPSAPPSAPPSTPPSTPPASPSTPK